MRKNRWWIDRHGGRLRRLLIAGATCAALTIALGSNLGCLADANRRSWERTFYPTITGQVTDAETGLPIEGAVALAVWTRKKGFPGLSHTEVYQTSEDVSDRDGRIKIQGILRPGMPAPDLTVYKRGYVAWNNKDIFNTVEDRKDFQWKNGFVAKMEKWKEGYSFNEHEAFISRSTARARTKSFADAMDWERLEQVKENDRIGEELKRRGLRK